MLLAVLALLPLGACGDKGASGPLKVPELEYGIDAPWPAPASLPPIGPAGRLAITNNLDDTLNPVELEGPHHTVASPDGAFYPRGDTGRGAEVYRAACQACHGEGLGIVRDWT